MQSIELTITVLCLGILDYFPSWDVMSCCLPSFETDPLLFQVALGSILESQTLFALVIDPHAKY